MEKHELTSIITGDIAGSRRAKAPGTWLEPLKRVLGNFGKAPQDWEIYRGDAFQVEIADPEEALKAAFLIKAVIKQQRNLDVRMAVGIGRAEHAAPAITERNGEAYINSGSRFDQLKDEKRRLAVCSPHADLNREMDLYLLLASVFMDQWTPHSAEVVALMLEEPGLRQAELATRLGISQPSVSERLSRARWEELQALDAMYRHKIKTLIT